MAADLSTDEVNQIITSLALPDPKIHVAVDYANHRSSGEVQAYAKLSGATWTYYVRTLKVVIGRQASDSSSDDEEVQIDLGPSKVVSRKHATIRYNGHFWEITISGRNGVKIDKVNHKEGTARLFSGNVLDIGGVQMMFVLPDSKPHIAQTFKKSLTRPVSSEVTPTTVSYVPAPGVNVAPEAFNQTQPAQFTAPHPQQARYAEMIPAGYAQYPNEIAVAMQQPVVQQQAQQYQTFPQPPLNRTGSTEVHTTEGVYANTIPVYQGQQSQIPIAHLHGTYQYQQHHSQPPNMTTDYLIQQQQQPQHMQIIQQQHQHQYIQVHQSSESASEQDVAQSKTKGKKGKQAKQSKKGTTKFINTDGKTVTETNTSESIPGTTTISTPISNSSSYPNGHAIFSDQQTIGSTRYFDQDLSGDHAKDIKPPFSYATMISQAILSTEEHMMSLADIYEWIATRYAYYRFSKSGWQNSIRHNLSLSKAFEKVPRKKNEPGKGMKWQIVQSHKEEFCRKAMQGDIIKGKSNHTNRLFKRSAAAAVAKEAAANKSISKIVKSMEERQKNTDTGSENNGEKDKRVATDTDKSSSQKENVPPATKEELSTATLQDSQSTNTDDSTATQLSTKKSLPTQDTTHAGAEKMNATTPRKLGTSNTSLLPTHPSSNTKNNAGSGPGAYTSPASALSGYAEQYPFAISDIAAGTALATLSTPSPTQRYSNSMLSAIENSGGMSSMINGIFSGNNGSADSLFGFGMGMGTNSMGISQLEAYTPDRGGGNSSHNSPNGSFRGSHSRSKSAVTPNTKLYFDGGSAQKSGGRGGGLLSGPNSVNRSLVNRGSPSRPVSVSAPSSNASSKTSIPQNTHDRNLTTSPPSSSSSPPANSSKSDGEDPIDLQRKGLDHKNETDASDSNNSDTSYKKLHGNIKRSKSSSSTDLEQSQLGEGAINSTQNNDRTPAKPMSNSSSSATVENENPNNRIGSATTSSSSAFNDQDAVGAVIGLRRRRRSDTVDAPELTTGSRVKSDDEATSNEDAGLNPEKDIEEPKTQENSPERDPLGLGASTIMSSVTSLSRTPAPVQANFQLTAPSSAQQKQLPSSFMLSGSPASYWGSGNQYQLSATQTPLRSGGTPFAFSLVGSGGPGSVVRGSGSLIPNTGGNRLGLLKSATGETVRRKRVSEAEYEVGVGADIELDEEDSDNMPFFSPSKNSAEFTPTVKKMKKASAVSGRLSQLNKPILSAHFDDNDEEMKDSEEKGKGKKRKSGELEESDLSTSPVTVKATASTSGHGDQDAGEDGDIEGSGSGDSSHHHSKKRRRKKRSSGGSTASAASRSSSVEGNTSVTSNSTVNLSSEGAGSGIGGGSDADVSKKNSIEESIDNDETAQAIQSLQSLHSLHHLPDDEADDGLGNLQNVDLTRGFHKIGKLAAAAAATIHPGNPSTRSFTFGTSPATTGQQTSPYPRVNSMGSPQKRTSSMTMGKIRGRSLSLSSPDSPSKTSGSAGANEQDKAQA